MRYPVSFFWLCLACLTLYLSACSNNTSATLNSTNLEQILVIDQTQIGFASQRNAPLPVPQLVSARFYGDHLTVQPRSPLPAWLTLEVNENRNQKLTLLQFSINNTQLAAGTYSTQIRLSVFRNNAFGRKSLGHRDLLVSYRVMDHFDTSEKQLKLNDVFGNNQTLTRHIHVYGTGSHWQASSTAPWIKLSRLSGHGNGEIALTIDLKHKKLHPGRQTAKISLTDQFSGRQLDVPLELLLQAPRLRVNKNGIALTQLYRQRNVSAIVTINGNTKKTIAWTAHTKQKWLQLTQATNGKSLSIKANPKGLKPGMHYATVTVNPKYPAKNKQHIQVGFYVNGNIRKPKPAIQLPKPHHRSDIVADPIRPFVYITAGSAIHRYHIYTGRKEIIEDLGTELAGLAVSNDGRFLYMADAADFSIRTYDLKNEELAQIWYGPFFETDAPRPHLQLSYAKPNGYPVLFNNSMVAFDAKNGNILGRFQAQTKPGQPCCKSNLPLIKTSGSGTSLYLLERAEHKHELYRFSVDYSYIKGVGLTVQQTGYMVEDGLALDLAVSPDGAEVCTVSTGTLALFCYYGDSVTPSRSLKLSSQPNNIEFGGIGDIYAATGSTGKRPAIWRINALSGKTDRRFPLQGEINDRQMILSADALSIITLSNDTQNLSVLITR